MKVYPHRSRFGWEGDGGLGERLISKILSGEKTATCCPKTEYTEKELKEAYDSVGEYVTVTDRKDEPVCNIKMLDVFETTFGDPHPLLLKGECCDNDADKFREAHIKCWGEEMKEKGTPLTDETVLIAEIFELSE